MRTIKTVHVGPVDTNCYLVCNPETQQIVIIDPGADPDAIRAEIRETGMLPAAILLTHGHFDHIGAVKELTEVYDVPVVAGKGEEAFLSDFDKILPPQFQEMLPNVSYNIHVDKWAEHEELIEYGGFPITCLATPGHTEGGMSYFFPTERILFSGDTLFMESIGRTDLPTGDAKVLIASIREQLYRLPDSTLVFPGHGPATNIEYEKRYNMYTWEKGQTKAMSSFARPKDAKKSSGVNGVKD
ncbi:MAG: MBL fold metallo-hydrolase [Lachnospiraceae bacterium]|nr:MBL fold metallo-hydrolase [Lachnospiraceae bacterium]